MKYSSILIILVLSVVLGSCGFCGLNDYKSYDQRCTSGCVAVWKNRCVAGEYDHWGSKNKRHVIRCSCYMKNGEMNGIYIRRRAE